MRRTLTGLLAAGLLGLPALTGTAAAQESPANSGDAKNCTDFATQAEAQTWYSTYFPLYGDVAQLDADGDGIACEGQSGSQPPSATPTMTPTAPPPTVVPAPVAPALQRRDVTIGITQAAGIYTFSGVVTPRAVGLQVTVARLDSVTKRVTGVASVKTDSAGRYTIRTRLPAGLAGYYTLTAPAPGFDAGRSRLYGLVVPRPPVPKVTGRVSIDPVGIDEVEGWYVLYGNIGPCVQDKVVNIYRESNGRRTLIARTQADCSDGAPHWGIAYSPGTLLGTHTYLAGIDGDTRVTPALSNRVRYTYSERFEGPEGQYVAGPNGFQVVGPNYISG